MKIKQIINVSSKLLIFTAVAAAIYGIFDLMRYFEKTCRNNFHNAIEAGNLELVKERYNRRYLNNGNTSHNYPIINAAWNGHFEIVKYLHQKGANLEVRDKDENMTALQIAMWIDKRDIANYLLKNGAYCDIFTAIELDDRRRISYLLNSGENNQYTISSYYKYSPIFFAIRGSKLKILEMLIDKGHDINFKNGFGETPLHYAVYHENIEAVKLLLQSGALFLKNKKGNTPLSQSVYADNLNLVKLLIKYGADIRVRNNDGFSLLHLAASIKKSNTLKYLIKLGLSVHSECKSGLTPIYCAIIWGNKENIEMLLKYGADINHVSKKNLTPLSMAEFWKKDLVPYLKTKGAKGIPNGFSGKEYKKSLKK